MPLITEDVVAFDINSGGGGGEPGEFNVSFFNPEIVYGLAGDNLRLYPRNLCPDPSCTLATDYTRSDTTMIPINNPDAGTTTINVRARRGVDTKALGSFDLVIADTPVSPSFPLNVIVIGDSTTAQYDDDGAAVNELSRRLTGVGRSIEDSAIATGFAWTGPAMPAPLNLSNIFFRGTLGTAAVKHEGRSGWRSSIYTSMATASGKTNAFWDPVNNRFSMTYYVEENGFDVATDPDGIEEDGSNLLVIVALGWNDVYREDDTGTSASVAAANLAVMIDAIHADMPNAHVLVPGLNPPAAVNFKGLVNPRWISQQEIFDIVIKEYGEAFRDVCESRSNSSFYAVAPVWDPQIAYGMSTYSRAFRSTETVQGAGDYVHSRPPGYAMWADAMCYWIINNYCQ